MIAISLINFGAVCRSMSYVAVCRMMMDEITDASRNSIDDKGWSMPCNFSKRMVMVINVIRIMQRIILK